MALELVAHIAIEAEMVKEEIALENTVLLHHPEVGFGYEGFEDGGGDIEMIAATQRVADVMQQGADHILFIAAVLERQRGSLQRMGITVDREAAMIAIEQLEMRQDAVGQGLEEGR